VGRGGAAEVLDGIFGAAATWTADGRPAARGDMVGGIYRQSAEVAILPSAAVNATAASWAERVDRVNQCRMQARKFQC
jgi:hypothetical protein